MKWEFELMRDMLERAREYENVQTFECMKTAAMLKQAATVMNQWHRKMTAMQTALEKIVQGNGLRESPEQIAREALE